VVDAIAAINRQRFAELPDPEIQTRLAQYEIAFQMQTSVPELVDMSNEDNVHSWFFFSHFYLSFASSVTS
jgi:hypothetical protein